MTLPKTDAMYFSTADEMAELDARAVAQGLEIRQMMELAGWHMLEMFRELAFGERKRVVVCAGKGNKGGDGLSAARHLANHGHAVSVVLSVARAQLKPDPAHHLRLLEETGVVITEYERHPDRAEQEIAEADIALDALIGYRLAGAPRGASADIILMLNRRPRVVSYDMPSGLDATSGEAFEPCIRACATLTLALPKRAFLTKTGAEKSGAVYVADLGIPEKLYDAVKKGSRPDFKGRLVKIAG